MNLSALTCGHVQGVRLLGTQIRGEPQLYGVLREFHPLQLTLDCAPPFSALPGPIIKAESWRQHEFDFRTHDDKLERAVQRSQWLNVDFATFNASVLFQILTRYQRWITSLPTTPSDALFERVLSAHRALHDLEKPLVRADYEHALDVLWWTVRLSPSASLSVRWAALFHDVERLRSEPDVRIEQFAPDYQAFKNGHAQQSARWAARILAQCGVDDSTRLEVIRLIQFHEHPRRAAPEPDVEVLADADALSFFSLNSSGFIDYYGRAHTEKKIAYTLGRMSPRARVLAHRLKLRPDVDRLFQNVIVAAHRSPVTSREATE